MLASTAEVTRRGDVGRFKIAGLSVRSEVLFDGICAPSDDALPADVTIRQGHVPPLLAEASSSGPTWQIADDTFLLLIPGVARFLITAGTDVIFQPDAGVSVQDLAIFLIGTAFAILLHQRGAIVLHASAVRVDGKAVLFCGPSGAGKSTLAVALADRGYAVVADDFCTLSTAADGSLFVHPDGRQLKLWAEVIDAFALHERRGAPVRNRIEKFYVAPPEAHDEPLPLGGIFILRERRMPDVEGIRRLNIAEAGRLLRLNAYRSFLVDRLGQREAYLRAAATAADVAGMYYLTRDFTFEAMPRVISLLEEVWQRRTGRMMPE